MAYGFGYVLAAAFETVLKTKVHLAAFKWCTTPANRIKILLQTQGVQKNLGVSGVLVNILSAGFGSFMIGGLLIMIKYYLGLIIPYLKDKLYKRQSNFTYVRREGNEMRRIQLPWWTSPFFTIVIAAIFMAPINTLIARSMASTPSSEFSTWNLVKSSFGSAEQILSLFNGVPVFVLMVYLRMFIQRGAKRMFFANIEFQSEKSLLVYYVLAIIVGIVLYPLDTINQNMMLSTTMDLDSLLTIPKDLIMNHGILALYSGLGFKLVVSIVISLIEAGVKYMANSGHGSFYKYLSYNPFEF